jgi:hypothetical protein
MADNDETVKKHIARRDIRIAEKNYHESHILLSDENKKESELTDEEVDTKCIESSRYFKWCYWRDYDDDIRKEIIRIKKIYGWTEQELRHLLLIGALQVNRLTGVVRPDPDKNIYRVGCVLFVAISLYYVCEILSVYYSDAPLKNKQAFLSGLLITWGMATYLIDYLFFKPYQLLIRPFVRGKLPNQLIY